MKTGIILATLAAMAVSCTTIQTPTGYAERERTGRYDYLAVSTDASRFSMRVQHNEDKKQGTLGFWSKAALKQMTLSRGYALDKQGDFNSPKGRGHWFLFSKKYEGVDHLYILGLVVDGTKIYVMEGGGEKDAFAKDVPNLVKAFATLD